MVVTAYRITLQQAMQAFGTRDRDRASGKWVLPAT